MAKKWLPWGGAFSPPPPRSARTDARECRNRREREFKLRTYGGPAAPHRVQKVGVGVAQEAARVEPPPLRPRQTLGHRRRRVLQARPARARVQRPPAVRQHVHRLPRGRLRHRRVPPASWGRRGRLNHGPPRCRQEPGPRIVGFSFRGSARADGRQALDSIHLSFFSRVLVLHLVGWGAGDFFPVVLVSFLESSRNLFVGDMVGEAAEMLDRDYGVRTLWGMDLGPAAAMLRAEGGDNAGEAAHVVLARSLLGWPEGFLVWGLGWWPWTAWPLSDEQVEFAVQSSVVS